MRFELTRPFGLPVFKTGAINRSATPPGTGGKRPTLNTENHRAFNVERWAFSLFWFEKDWTKNMFNRTFLHGAPEVCPGC